MSPFGHRVFASRNHQILPRKLAFCDEFLKRTLRKISRKAINNGFQNDEYQR